ncbi:MAG: pitrilysin family protein [Ignavibacteriales bacterium]|nr:pitrilysin family protein [Ignavibacteriales bacterium]
MKKIFLLSINLIIISAFCFSLYAQTPDRTKPPQLPAPKKLNLPAIQQFTLSNGLKVVLMEKHEVPLIQLNVTVKAGSVNDPENKIGLAWLTFNMLADGAAGKTSLELSDAIDFLGARISANASFHSGTVSLHSPLSKFDDALKIMSDIVLRPDFPQKELDRKKKDRLTLLMQAHDQPTAIASAAFNQILFGKEHPYGRITSEKEIRSYSTDDLKNFYKKYFVANNAVVIAVGDIKKEDLKKKLESAFGKWQKGSVKETKVKEPTQIANRIVYLIDKPGAAQSVINIGRIGAARLTNDYNSIVVMNTLLGGSFTSRLNQNLREKNGYTYGANSRFFFRPVPGSFIATSSVQTAVTDKALTEFFNELNGIREPLTDPDLNRAKNLVALSYPGNFQSVSEIAGQLEEKVLYNLPENYFGEFISKILSLTGKDVNDAAVKYIVPDQMIVVVVGDKAKIEDGIKKLNLGEIKNLSIDDVLGEVPKLDK